ncbi:hypothetical protein RJT34_17882 [Clitoria ternatea]|uniref:Auxin-induced protein n=1 Tax=Clitoria ternatea TaxID=43366 RepID=A0AAN9PE48_CLITE
MNVEGRPKATKLTLGLPGTQEKEEKRNNNKRQLPQTSEDSVSVSKTHPAPPAKERIVGWPPIRSYRKNNLQVDDGIYVKVSMDGAPYLRKIDLKLYMGYPELLKALETMFKFTIGEYSERQGYKGSEYAPIYEDKDGDWMLLGDVPWDMFMTSCKRLRIMKGSEARGYFGFCDGVLHAAVSIEPSQLPYRNLPQTKSGIVMNDNEQAWQTMQKTGFTLDLARVEIMKS